MMYQESYQHLKVIVPFQSRVCIIVDEDRMTCSTLCGMISATDASVDT